ncbi:MAG: diguanylate cyclase [Candidatus Dormibacteria bacterium]
MLVADDDPGSRLVAQATVEGLGHECASAPDGGAAWTLFEESPPDVLLTDWMMPGLDGLELCRRIRALPGDRYTYIILITSMSDRGNVLAGMQAGVDDYLTKPLDPFVLETRLLAAGRVTSLHAELAIHRSELLELSRSDPLTNLGNRRSLSEHLDLLHARSARYGRSYSLAFFDVDYFKAYNDTYGHQAGDDALRAVAAVLDAQGRRTDGIYRYGGEEFVLVMPETDLAGAMVLAERVRRAVQERAIPHTAGTSSGVLTVSAGVAGLVPAGHLTGDEVLREADRRLYRAKAAGRNRVVASASPEPVAP